MVLKGNKLAVLTATIATLSVVGCAKKDDATSSNAAIAVSGSLSLGNSSSGFQKMTMMSKNGDSDVDALALSDYTAVCATTTVPILSGSSPVASNGTFSVSIAGAEGQPLSCYLTDSTGAKAADFLVENTAKKDLNGNTEKASTITPTGDVNMDAITFNAATGEVIVQSTTIASAITTEVSGTVFDPTGTWTISPVDFTLPNGVLSPCTAAQQAAHTCDGPPEGQSIYLKLWNGTLVADGSAVHGLQVWEGGQSGFTSCGSRIGLSPAQKTAIGVDFSSNGTADQAFSFPTSVTFTDQILSASSSPNLTNNWEMSTATALYDFNPNCGPVDVTIGTTAYTNAWKCGPDSGGNYQIGLSGGCSVDSTGKSADINDWNGMSCQTTANADGSKTNVCTGTKTVNSASVAVTCRNSWVVTDASNTVRPNGTFTWSQMTGGITSGTACSAISTATNASRMAQLRCYADYYQRSGLADYTGACLPRVNMDWSATTDTNFVHKDFRPKQLVFFEQYKPFTDGTGGSMITRQEHFEGVQLAGGNSWVNCEVIDTGGLNIKKISANKLLVTYQSSLVTSSTAKPACMAKFTGKKQTFVFYMTK